MTPLFTTVKDVKEKANALNNDFSLISKWAFNSKIIFNPDPSKPSQEALVLRKMKLQIHSTISLFSIQVVRTSYQKHLGILLDKKLTFK